MFSRYAPGEGERQGEAGEADGERDDGAAHVAGARGEDDDHGECRGDYYAPTRFIEQSDGEERDRWKELWQTPEGECDRDDDADRQEVGVLGRARERPERADDVADIQGRVAGLANPLRIPPGIPLQVWRKPYSAITQATPTSPP